MLYPAHPPSLVLNDVALLLDVDGTLLDLALRPDEVVVPDTLRHSLARLAERTEGALALVSGRPIADLDRLFAPLRFAAVGGHGAEVRATPRGPIDASQAYPLDPELARRLAAAAETRPGVVVENKVFSLALHYRLAPQCEDDLKERTAAICAEWPEETIDILPGKFVIEIKHKGVNKGLALRKLMELPPFAGRTPIFVGDDITDETAIATVPEYDGFGYSVGRPLPGAVFRFNSPEIVRSWLEKISLDGLTPP